MSKGIVLERMVELEQMEKDCRKVVDGKDKKQACVHFPVPQHLETHPQIHRLPMNPEQKTCPTTQPGWSDLNGSFLMGRLSGLLPILAALHSGSFKKAYIVKRGEVMWRSQRVADGPPSPKGILLSLYR